MNRILNWIANRLYPRIKRDKEISTIQNTLELLSNRAIHNLYKKFKINLVVEFSPDRRNYIVGGRFIIDGKDYVSWEECSKREISKSKRYILSGIILINQIGVKEYHEYRG